MIFLFHHGPQNAPSHPEIAFQINALGYIPPLLQLVCNKIVVI